MNLFHRIIAKIVGPFQACIWYAKLKKARLEQADQ